MGKNGGKKRKKPPLISIVIANTTINYIAFILLIRL